MKNKSNPHPCYPCHPWLNLRVLLSLCLLLAFTPPVWAEPPVWADASYKSTAAEKSKLVYTGRGRVNHVVVYNCSGSTFYLQVYDAAAVPADLSVVDFSPVQVPANSTAALDFVNGHPFTAGLVVLASSTDTNKTLIANNGAWFTVSYHPL